MSTPSRRRWGIESLGGWGTSRGSPPNPPRRRGGLLFPSLPVFGGGWWGNPLARYQITSMKRPDRIELAPGLEISRVVTGLWQVADMERGGKNLDLDGAAAALGDYAAAGFDTFDMADHYGSAEDITGRFRQGVAAGKYKAAVAFTKW